MFGAEKIVAESSGLAVSEFNRLLGKLREVIVRRANTKAPAHASLPIQTGIGENSSTMGGKHGPGKHRESIAAGEMDESGGFEQRRNGKAAHKKSHCFETGAN